ncbi:hypothetical protein OIU84_003693 [Salix udensis]|uniref:K-box domain-containing protein n=1 Tax=Salix udensis TaxID=889485 RepID=A0AAD6P3J5_9ROSI|nr:hypothetical protein OIU84_003693 [Salix udensis]
MYEAFASSPCLLELSNHGVIEYYLSGELILVTKAHLLLIQYSTASIVKRYESRFEKVATANHAEVNCGKHANFKSHAELLLMIERNLEGPQAMELTLSDLVELENQLDAALTHVRARKQREGF